MISQKLEEATVPFLWDEIGQSLEASNHIESYSEVEL
jgi:hypothetical protein